VGLAIAAGGRVNITCVVVDVVAEPDTGAPDTADGDTADAERPTGAATGVGPAGSSQPGDASAEPVGRSGAGSGAADNPAHGEATSLERGGTTLLTAWPLDEVAAGGRPLEGDDVDAGRAHRPRRLTVRVVAFFVVIVVVLGVAVLAVGWYATRTYFVAFDGEQVVIYRGRPGGLLWIEPTVKEPSAPSLDRAALVGALCDRVEGEPSATSLSAARAIVEQLRRDAAQLGVPSAPCGGSS
jgi:protein phosphatase